MQHIPFRMERWQSTYEHRVRYNLSESGVHPMTVGELLELTGAGADLDSLLLGYGQSNGSDELRSRIAAQYAGATAESVLVTVGGAEANFTAFWNLMEPGRKAAVLLPTYMQVPGLLESFGAVPVPVPLLEGMGWQPDLEELERAASDVGFILVTNPNNPTGAALTEESMDRIVEIADRSGAWILSDEVYRGAELMGVETPSFWGRYERVLVTNSLSKAYGLPGLRVGWVVGPDRLMEGLWSRTDYTTICIAAISDRLATLALEPGARERIRARTRGILNGNVALLREWLDSHPGRFKYRLPDAGAICFVRYQDEVSSSDFSEYLRTEKDVLVVPGDHFGMDRYLRIGFGPPAADLVEALDRIDQAFSELAR